MRSFTAARGYADPKREHGKDVAHLAVLVQRVVGMCGMFRRRGTGSYCSMSSSENSMSDHEINDRNTELYVFFREGGALKMARFRVDEPIVGALAKAGFQLGFDEYFTV